jgi:hypothetical protein
MDYVDYSIEGYECRIKNLGKEAGRGIIIWIRQDLDFTDFKPSKDFEESLWISITLNQKEKLLFECIYRSPNSSEENTSQLNDLLRDIANKKHQQLLITGDFNFPGINWSTNSGSNERERTFLDAVNDSFLHQHVDKPTHWRPGQNPTLIDLILTSDDVSILNLTHLSPLAKSHHACLLFDYVCIPEFKNSQCIKTCYNRGDYQSLRTYLLNVPWEQEFQNLTSIDDMYERLERHYHQGCAEYIPTKTVRANKNHLSGIGATEKRAMNKRNRAWTRYMETRSATKYREYTKLRNKVKSLTRKARKRQEDKVVSEVKENPKSFWQHVKKTTKSREKIPDLQKAATGNEKTSSDTEKAEVLSQQFASVFTNEPDPGTSPIPAVPPRVYEEELADCEITEEDVLKELQNLDPNKSMGPDGLHPRVLKEVAPALSKPLRLIFQHSIDTGSLPSKWKSAIVSAIFKKGDRQLASNYRPISLTSIPCKVLERIIRRKIVDHMNGNDLFSKLQFGFREKRSTALQLLYCLEDWLELLDEGTAVDTCFLDLQKAFDTVPHQRLLRKTDSYGIKGKILKWIQDFLSNRTQHVVVNGTSSTPQKVRSGVPQGSVLGPVLFILYVNDMPEAVQSSLLLYADDAKMYRPIRSTADVEQMQTDIDALQVWATKWLLTFHPAKCKVMRIGSRDTPTTSYHMTTEHATTTLAWSTLEKDLGVLVDNQLHFDEEISARVKKANNIVGIIRRSFLHLNEKSFALLYNSLVRPHLEYAASVWLPHKMKDINEIEKVQRRATKLIPTIKHLSYADRLRKLLMTTQRYRHLRGDMINIYKIMTGLHHVDPTHFFSPPTAPNTRGHSRKLGKPRSRTNQRLHSFTRRVVEEWNRLPEDVANAPSLNSFKNRLDKHWSRHPSKYAHNE